MEPASAGKGEDCDGYLATRRRHLPLGIVDISRIENNQRSTLRGNRRRGGKTAGQAAVGKFAILRTVILERPAESAAVKGFAALNILSR